MTSSRPTTLTALLLAACVLLPMRASAGEGDGDRWDSFSRLIKARWRDRAIGALNDPDTDDLWTRCLDDAWFLPLPGLVEDPDTSPCGQLLRPRHVRQARESVVAEWKRRMSRRESPPTRQEWTSCTALARKHQDAVLLSACGTALRGRSDRLASMPDKERFDRWLSACKESMGVEPPVVPPVVAVAPEKSTATAAAPDAGTPEAVPADAGTPADAAASVDAGTPAPTPPAAEVLTPIPASELDQARHCHRLLPTFYEVHGFKKASEYWTPAELKLLTRRMKQLAGE